VTAGRGRDLLASGGGGDGTVRIWDPRTGEQLTVLEGHQGGVRAVCAVTVGGRDLLASGGGETVRLWDPRTGTCTGSVPTHHQALGVAAVPDAIAIGLDVGILVIKPNAFA
jgi:WD40 repeat protein